MGSSIDDRTKLLSKEYEILSGRERDRELLDRDRDLDRELLDRDRELLDRDRDRDRELLDLIVDDDTDDCDEADLEEDIYIIITKLPARTHYISHIIFIARSLGR
jgi:hypothetical protein